MADLPIPFKAPMVRALLAGTKTQTRRILTGACDEPPAFIEKGEILALDQYDLEYRWPRTYAVGDWLWVREAWRTPSSWDDRSPSQLVASCREAGYLAAWAPITWEADGTTTNWLSGWAERRAEKPGRLRASMHLPRDFSRLTLTVTEVRVQRLQEISEADAIAEGILVGEPLPELPTSKGDIFHDGVTDPLHGWTRNPIGAFRSLWDSINGPGAWEANPWVAAYTFIVEHRNIDALSEGGR